MNVTDPTVTIAPTITRVEVTSGKRFEQGDLYAYGPARPQYVGVRLVTGDEVVTGQLRLYRDKASVRVDGTLYPAPAGLDATAVRELFDRVEEYRLWDEAGGQGPAPCRCWPAQGGNCARCLADEVDRHVLVVEREQLEYLAKVEKAHEAVAILMDRIVEEHPELEVLTDRVKDAIAVASLHQLETGIKASAAWAHTQMDKADSSGVDNWVGAGRLRDLLGKKSNSDNPGDAIDWFGAERIRVLLAAMAAA